MLNYYAREGERVACGDLVYTVDETGRLNDYLQSTDMGDNALSERELAELRGEIGGFVHSFDPTNFDSIYNFKYSDIQIQGFSIFPDIVRGLLSLCHRSPPKNKYLRKKPQLDVRGFCLYVF